MASRELRDLSPTMRVLHDKFMTRCRRDTNLLKAGITVLVTCTYRSNDEQARLYAQGRTAPGRIVTRAKPGKSKHNVVDVQGKPHAEAFDVVPLRHGKPIWGTRGDGIDDDPTDDDTDDLEAWQRIGEHAMAVGLKWYGAPGSSFREFPHMQNPDV